MSIGVSLVAALALLIGASDASTATPTPNVRGVVTGVVAPGCYPGEPCDPPVRPAFVAFRRVGRLVARPRIGLHGAFAVHLAPGWYTVGVTPSVVRQKVVPAGFRVPPSGVVHVTLRIVLPTPPDS